MAEILISNGANIEKRIWNWNGYTRYGKYTYEDKNALHIAVENNSKEIVEVLISKGADINAVNIVYQTIMIVIFF